MSALTGPRYTLVPNGTIKKLTLPLKAGIFAHQGGMCCYDTASVGAVTKGAVSTTLVPIGKFTEEKDNSGGGTSVPVGVELTRERELEYWDSVTGAGQITAANLFQEVYIASDHELTTVSTGASPHGIVWTVSPQGAPGAVGVEPLNQAR